MNKAKQKLTTSKKLIVFATVLFLIIFSVFMFFNIDLLTEHNWRILYVIFLIMLAALLFALIVSGYMHYKLVKFHQSTLLRGIFMSSVLLFLSLFTGQMAILTVLDLFSSTEIIAGGCVIERLHYRRGGDFFKVNFSADEYVYIGQDDYVRISNNPRATYSSCQEKIEVEYTPHLKVAIDVKALD